MTDSTQTVTVIGRRPDSDEVSIVLGDRRWAGWVSVRITRGLERMPSDFEVGLTELYPGEADMLVAHVGDACQVYIGRDLVITGYVDRVTPSIAPGRHDVMVSGRGKCQDLVDCSAEWKGSQIIASSVLEVAQKLAAPFKIEAYGEKGPPVGNAQLSRLIPYLALMLGETPWEVIERLCRITGYTEEASLGKTDRIEGIAERQGPLGKSHFDDPPEILSCPFEITLGKMLLALQKCTSESARAGSCDLQYIGSLFSLLARRWRIGRRAGFGWRCTRCGRQ